MTDSSVGLAASRTMVIIITIITLIIIAVMVSVSVTAPNHLGRTREIFNLFLEGIVDFVEMVGSGICAFKSKFSKIVHEISTEEYNWGLQMKSDSDFRGGEGGSFIRMAGGR